MVSDKERQSMLKALLGNESTELDKRKAGIRGELWQAFDNLFEGQSSINTTDALFGGIVYEGFKYDKNTEEDAKVELARMQIIPSEKLMEKSRKHGIAKIEVCLNFVDGPIIIDTLVLMELKPKYAWMRLKPKSLTVFVSSGKNTPPKNCGKINLDKKLEGFALVFNYKVNPKSEIPYHPFLAYLYSPKKT